METKTFDARFRIASVRVVNDAGRFDDKKLVPEQMEDAIRSLHGNYGCRVINISLGDDARTVESKPSAWAAVLDELARELDLVIVLSAGNTRAVTLIQRYGDKLPDEYPEFLFLPENRILEPGSSANCLVVGSISHTNGIADDDNDLVGVRPITAPGEPSPFTRVGPGVGEMIKPDLVDYGGTALLYGERLADGSMRPAAGIVSLNSKYIERYFTTGSGTSYAAPLVAFKAAMIRQKFPDASANLVRALMALSADIPEAALDRLEQHGKYASLQACGYGLCDVERALDSEDDRVILYREDSLRSDRFAIYEVPIPDAFQTERGDRHIRVSLAFDPPTRHTRLDYLGVTMGFHLIRGAEEGEVFNHFRKWEEAEGEPFRLENRLKCSMLPPQTIRERGTLQCGSFVAKRDISEYGGRYFLAVRCESGWAEGLVGEQRFAVAVELQHEAEIQLYQRLRERVQIRT